MLDSVYLYLPPHSVPSGCRTENSYIFREEHLWLWKPRGCAYPTARLAAASFEYWKDAVRDLAGVTQPLCFPYLNDRQADASMCRCGG